MCVLPGRSKEDCIVGRNYKNGMESSEETLLDKPIIYPVAQPQVANDNNLSKERYLYIYHYIVIYYGN